MPDDPGPPDGRLATAAAELYAAAPEEFTGRRGELAAAARDAGDRAAAAAIAALRRPTRAAWVVNTLARADPGAPAALAGLAAALTAAQQSRDGPRLRALSAERGRLVDALTARALAAAGVADPPPALRLEVAETIGAALADPGTAADFAAGTLTRAVQWSGFGVLPAGGDGEPAADSRPDAGTTSSPRLRRPAARAPAGPAASGTDAGTDAGTKTTGSRGKVAQARGEPRARAGETAARGSGQRAQAAAPRTEATAARRQAQDAERAERAAREAAERTAREAGERTARRREQYAEAERTAAAAASAAAEAGAAEDRLEAEVRDLEERLTRARSDLTAARLRARRAEVAERRARQALDRAPRE